MAEVRVFNIGDEILVSQGNTTATFYDKKNVKWFVVDQQMILNDVSGDEDETLLTFQPSDFYPNQSDISVIDLLINLNNMLLVGGSLPEKLVSGDYTLTNDDANYLILWDLSGGNATMKMPPDAIAGLLWRVKDTGSAAISSNEGTINGNGRNIEGVATAPVIDQPYEARWMRLSGELGEYLFD
jgi:hypothetical protein